MRSSPRYSLVIVIIPVYERLDVARIITIIRHYPQQKCGFQILIVDNGNVPEFSSRLMALQANDCEVIRLPENRGGAGAFRAGMARALELGGDFVWLLDDDALVNGRTLPALLEEYLRLECEGVRVGAVGSAMLGRRNPHQVTEVGCAIGRATGRLHQRFFGKDVRTLEERTDEVEYVAAASCLTRLSVLREMGPFEDVFIHCDDIEWCFRLRKAGYRIFATTRSTINHMEWEAKFADWLMYYDTRNVLWYLRKYLPLTACGAWLKLRLQQLFLRMHGCNGVARLMTLGFRHARTGELLLRGALPESTWRQVPLNEALANASEVMVFAKTRNVADIWKLQLRGLPHHILCCEEDNTFPMRLLHVGWHQLGIQFRLWRSKRAVLFFDSCSVKNWPMPLWARQKYYFLAAHDRIQIFQEEGRA